MDVTLDLQEGLRFAGTNRHGDVTLFDSRAAGPDAAAAAPMEVLLQAVAACSAMDAVSILRKKRKTVSRFRVRAHGEQAEEHPRVFTSVHLVYELESPDAALADLDRSVELSMTKYCPGVALLAAAGVAVTSETVLTTG